MKPLLTIALLIISVGCSIEPDHAKIDALQTQVDLLTQAVNANTQSIESNSESIAAHNKSFALVNEWIHDQGRINDAHQQSLHILFTGGRP
jgi:hypothetical protein